VFLVTQSVQRRDVHIDDLNHQLLSEQQALRVLDAEWAYLTRPQRLEELMTMKADHETMPPVPAIATLSAPAKEAAPEAQKAQVQEPAEKPKKHSVAEAAPVKPAKRAVRKAAAKPKPASNDVWPIAHRSPAAQAHAYIPRAGVARPILE
jgi:hypothetical protein